MSHEEDCCFQCQESGHIALHYPTVRCFECDEYGHIVVELSTLDTTPRYACMSPQTKIPYQTLYQTDFSLPSPGQVQAWEIKVTVLSPQISQSKSPCFPTDAIPSHIIETTDITIEVLHDALTPILIIPTMTPHTADHLHTGAHQLTLGITADHTPVQHTNQVRQPCINLHPVRAEIQAICMIKEIQESR